jgi:hypothetical protein
MCCPPLRRSSPVSAACVGALVAAWLVAPLPALAQPLPAGPVSAFDGRLAVGAEVVATIGERDTDAFFNYTDYEHNTLRMFRVALSAAWRPVSRVAVVGEVRSEDLDVVRPYAAYIRIRPWSAHAFDVQVGRIPPTFGAFGRRGYQGADNPLIGYPLAYQYLTSLRPDAVPATVADILVMRGRGWRASYPIGSQEPAPGVPLISAFRWDTGIQAHWEGQAIDVTGSVTTGTLADPRLPDNNGGKQVSARVASRPTPGLLLGASAARGEFFDRDVALALPDSDGSHAQSTLGADAEYSQGHWLIRSELVWARWNVPFATPPGTKDLDALGVWVEGRYRVTPRIVVSGRADRLGFSRLDVGPNLAPTWDANVWRVEAGAGYYIQRNLIARLAVQHNDRDGGRVRARTYVSGQVAYWF